MKNERVLYLGRTVGKKGKQKLTRTASFGLWLFVFILAFLGVSFTVSKLTIVSKDGNELKPFQKNALATFMAVIVGLAYVVSYNARPRIR